MGFLRRGVGFLLPFKGHRPHVAGVERARGVRSKIMNDIIFVGVMVGFFVIAALYVRVCDKL